MAVLVIYETVKTEFNQRGKKEPETFNTTEKCHAIMRLSHIKYLALIPVIIAGGLIGVANGDDFFDQQKMASQLIVDMFLINVDQGKLEIFGQKIERSQLESEQVAYIHNLKDDSLSITLYLGLKKSLRIPHFEDFHVDAISIDIDKDGTILQVKSHIVPDQQ